MLTTLEREHLERELLTAEANQYEALKRDEYLSSEDAAARVNAERAATVDPALAMKAALALREQVLFDDAPDVEAARAAIVADRLDRWTAWVEGMGSDGDAKSKIALWAQAMARKHGITINKQRIAQPECKMHGIVMPWEMALLVLQYGESEYFWPTEWSAQDVKRAELWLGEVKVPSATKGFKSIPVEG